MPLNWIVELVRDGIRNLVRHKLRSTLTLLGVVFGVSAVITMLAIGEGGQRSVLKEISGLGLNNIIIDSVESSEANRPKKTTGSKTDYSDHVMRFGLTFKDVDQIRAITPESELVVGHWVRSRVFSGSSRINAKVLGVTPSYFRILNTRLLDGRLPCDLDEQFRKRVVVISSVVAEGLKKSGSMVGHKIKVGLNSFEVIGVIAMPSSKQAEAVYMPYKTAVTLFGSFHINTDTGSPQASETAIGQIVLNLKDDSIVPDAAIVVQRILDANHLKKDFSITVPLELLRTKQRTQRILNLVLIAIAAISLVVGGIGIMNIMLANVTERIPEIGIRRALGARQRDILLQFLTETITLSTIGGLLGCALGIITVPLTSIWTDWPGVITPWAVIVSLVVSWCVGVIFGIAPAMRAAKMDPVESLRYE